MEALRKICCAMFALVCISGTLNALDSATGTRAYVRFGDIAVPVSSSNPKGIERNISYGINLENPDSFGYETLNGETSLTTKVGSGVISLVFDPALKNSVSSGIVLSLDYFDRGKDSFEVQAYDSKSGTWKNIQKVTKGDKKFYKNVLITLTGLQDLRIDDNGDGEESLRSVEINYVLHDSWLKDALGFFVAANRYLDDAVLDKSVVQGKKMSAPYYADAPSFGAWLPVIVPEGGADIKVRLYKQLKVNSFTPAFSETDFSLKAGEQVLSCFYDPQVTGAYKVELEVYKGSLRWMTVADVGNAQAMQLTPRMPGPVPARIPRGKDVFVWDYAEVDKNLYAPVKGFLFMSLGDGILQERIVQSYPELIMSTMSLKAGADQVFVLTMMNGTGASFARLYWRSETGVYSAANSIFVPLVPNDTRLREYLIPVGRMKTWKGSMAEFRLIPVDGYVEGGIVELKSLILTTFAN